MTLEQRLQLAGANLGSGVVRINKTAAAEALHKNEGYLTFGVKNTTDIPDKIIDKLRNNPDFLWLTVDRMAPLGRSVDTGLTNPLTYRHMTGSTSGGAVNILNRITDVAIGTDGGGSVLAPALAASLFSFMGKGLGLTVETESTSTDGLGFVGGIGLLAAELWQLEKAAEALCGLAAAEALPETVYLPAPGCMALPDGGDCYELVAPVLQGLGIGAKPLQLADAYDRAMTVQQLKELDGILLTVEGPVDVYAYDETIPRAFKGGGPQAVAGTSSKAVVKAANIAGWCAFTVPTYRLATGFVVASPPGEGPARQGLALAKALANACPTPEMFQRFFIQGKKYVKPSRYE